jgi:hypothetical protein
MDWNIMMQVVIGAVAVLALAKAWSAERKIRQMKAVHCQHMLDLLAAGKMQLDAIERNRLRIVDIAASVGGTITRVTRIEEKQMVRDFPIHDKVASLDKRMQCLTGGHLDPVCPRCLEPLVMADAQLAPTHEQADKPRRRPRAIRETTPDIDPMPPAKIVEGVS